MQVILVLTTVTRTIPPSISCIAESIMQRRPDLTGIIVGQDILAPMHTTIDKRFKKCYLRECRF